MTGTLIVVALNLCQMVSGDPFPERLKKVLNPHARTAYVEWAVRYVGGRDDGLVERHVTQRAGDTVWESNKGDALGRHQRSYRLPEGVPDDARLGFSELEEVPPEEDAGARHYLLYDKHTWQMFDRHDHLFADVSVVDERHDVPWPLDPTLIGLSVSAAGPNWHGPTTFGLPKEVLQGFESATFTTSSQGDIDTVTARFDGKRLEWDFDKRRGDRPIRAAFYIGDKLFNSSRTDLVEIDGQWYAKKSRFYMTDSATPYKVVEVQEASFDEPWHLQEITPDDIGVVFGTRLHYLGGDRRTRFWNGAELITSREYRELTQLYDIMPHPSILEWLAGNRGISPEEYKAIRLKHNEAFRTGYLKKHGEIPSLAKNPKEEDQWDLYVRKFIETHNLTGDGQRRAGEVLARSKRLRDWHLHKYRKPIKEAERKGDTARLKRYHQPVQRIFDKMLKPGLEKLVPKKRRAKATTAAAGTGS